MTPDQVKKLTPFERLVYWVTERESIRRKKALGLDPPWTDDPILQSYRFCNVRRMDDKVSDWLWTKWYRPNRNHPSGPLACLLARQLNRVETLAAVGFPSAWDPDAVHATLARRAAAGEKVFSAAYMITGTLGGTKAEQVVYKVVDHFHRTPPVVDPTSMERTWTAVQGRPGVKSFMAGQVVADLRWAWTGPWKDKHDWAPVGPGSARGLARLLDGNDWDVRRRAYFAGGDAWLVPFRTLVGKLVKTLPADVSNRLEAMDYQNCLCEFDKYTRALTGDGRPKQLYRGGAA